MRVLSRPVLAALSAAAAATALSAPAQASIVSGFTDYYAPGNWTFTDEGSAGGSVNTGSAPTSIAIISPDEGAPALNAGKPGTALFTITAGASGQVSFKWNLIIGQDEVLAFNDPFGFVLNGTRTQLSDDDEADQNGSFSTSVTAGDTFGFYASSLDGRFGASTTTITEFAAPVPGPLPALGAIVAFRTSRKLRSRLRGAATNKLPTKVPSKKA